MYARAGDDALVGGAGDDNLNGEAGNDVLEGGAGNDTYVVGTGTGSDRISDYDATAGAVDTVKLADIASSAVTAIERSGEDLVIKYGTSDQVTVGNYFSAAGYRVERFEFSDGVVWDDAAVKARVITNGTAASEYFTGYDDGPNRIFGLGGNDVLYGGSQADVLDGGDGNDTVYARAGDDALVGGAGDDNLNGEAGNDVLSGGAGNDTYAFGKGTGADVVSNYSSGATSEDDQAAFGAGIAADQIWAQHVGSDLKLTLIETGETLTIQNWYAGSAYRVDSFRLADGRRLVEADVEALVSAMAAFAPPAPGQSQLPQEYQDALAVTLAASWK